MSTHPRTVRSLSLLAALAASNLALAGPADVSAYDDLAEGFLGDAFEYHGILYTECNNVAGSFPSGETFTPQDIGDQFIIENSTFLFDAFPDFGSRDNTLTFGTAYIPGPNLSLGAFARATMTLPASASHASVEMAFYENGPWGGIVFHLDALRDGQVVDSATYTIADGGGRDNVTTTTLSVSDQGAGFDQLKLYATWNDGYSAPRLMIDNLTVTYPDTTCPADFNADGFVDFFDFTAYVDCFEGIECPPGQSADFNADGFVDFFDFQDFVDAFEAWC
ncbi:MAG: hypothetical protein HRU70_05500 [Phycisphaeraceae bacterium]|nr:MAG: hypothetical protein HRU70_05500 [Phycisphaeraceae bacterium]